MLVSNFVVLYESYKVVDLSSPEFFNFKSFDSELDPLGLSEGEGGELINN
jgi:hypothetical protein